jgi:predicted lipoprotein with Yx(FWY)xxD motif
VQSRLMDGGGSTVRCFTHPLLKRVSCEDIAEAGREVYSMRKMLFFVVFAAGVLVLAATGASATREAKTAASRAASVVISTRKLPKLGTVLVNSKGFTLYMFVPDKRRKVTCVRTCAAVWPPVKLSKGQKPAASGKAKASLLASDPNPAGGRVVTYNKWPLYTYVADTARGQAKGQALNLNGGLWYVLAPSGKVIKTKP